MTNTDTAALLRRLFFYQSGHHAEQWRTKDGRVGYSPACDNRFSEACKARGFRCADCSERAPTALTDERLAEHLAGRITLGAYQLRDDGTAGWLCLDVDADEDSEHARDNVKRLTTLLAAKCAQIGLPTATEFTGSKGFHLWAFCPDGAPARDLRRLGLWIVDRVLEDEGEPPDLHIEVFPKQDRLDANDPYGNLVKTPLSRHKKTGNRCLFVDGDWKPYPDQIEHLAGVQTVTAAEIAGILEEWVPAESEPPKAAASAPGSGRLARSTRDFMAHGAPQGERNDRLFRAAADMAGNGYAETEIAAILLGPATAAGLEEREALTTIESACSKARNPSVPADTAPAAPPEVETLADLAPWVNLCLEDIKGRAARWAIGDGLASWLTKRGRLLVDMTQDAAQGGRPYLVADDGAIWPLERDAVPTRLTLYPAGLNRTEHLYNFVLEALVMAAVREGQRVRLARWQGYQAGILYVSSGPTLMVRACDSALELVPNGSDGIWFAGDACYPSWQPTTPVAPFSLAAFQPTLEAPDEVSDYTPEAQAELLGAWLAGLLSGLRPLPILVPLGQRGGGKSTLSKAIMAMLLGPDATVARLSEDYRDFASLVTSAPLVAFDNLDSAAPPWFPDALSAAVTGLADQRRQLYTDGVVLSRPATACFVITTRSGAFLRADVAERSIPLLTGAFEDERRQSDAALAESVAAQRDGLLSWGALTAQSLLALRAKAPPALPLRFVDFAQLVWAYLARQERGPEAAGMLLALRQAQALTIGEADPLTVAILGHFEAIADQGFWQGQATALVRELQNAGAELPYLGGGKRIARTLRETKATLAVMGLTLKEERDANRHVLFQLFRAQSAQYAQSGRVGRKDGNIDGLGDMPEGGEQQGTLADCAFCADCATPDSSSGNGNGHHKALPPLDADDQAVLDALSALGRATYRSVALALRSRGQSDDWVRQRLDALVQRGLASRDGRSEYAVGGLA